MVGILLHFVALALFKMVLPMAANNEVDSMYRYVPIILCDCAYTIQYLSKPTRVLSASACSLKLIFFIRAQAVVGAKITKLQLAADRLSFGTGKSHAHRIRFT